MVTLLVFLAVLAILVLSHEWGHFIVARLQGIRVQEFGFGFPPRLFGIRRTKGGSKKFQMVWGRGNGDELEGKETLYSVNLIPLGGFVRIKGEDGDSSEARDPDSFAAKKAWQKSLVLVAGVVMNIVLAAVLLSVGFMVGFPSAVDPTTSVSGQTELQVIQVLPDKPAEAAGVVAGDVIVGVDGLQHPRLTDLQNFIDTHRNEDITVTIDRNGEQLTKKIHPTVYADTGRGGIGVALVETALIHYPWYQAVYQGVVMTGVYLKEIILAFWYLIKGIVVGAGITGAVSGPVGVAVMTGQAARMGITYLLQFAALLSLNLAVLNIFPIPALDGGRLFFVILGKITRERVSAKVEQTAHMLGFVLLMALVVFVTVKDIGTFGGGFVQWIKQII